MHVFLAAVDLDVQVVKFVVTADQGAGIVVIHKLSGDDTVSVSKCVSKFIARCIRHVAVGAFRTEFGL